MSQGSSNNDREQACYVKSFDLAMACTFHNRSANVFNSHLALCKVLMGMEDSLPSYNRLPQIFRGEDQDQLIRAERVNSTEIETLIRNSISPFGGRQIIGRNGDSKEDRVKKIQDMFRNRFPDLDESVIIGIGSIDADDVVASSEEGIEDLRLKGEWKRVHQRDFTKCLQFTSSILNPNSWPNW